MSFIFQSRELFGIVTDTEKKLDSMSVIEQAVGTRKITQLQLQFFQQSINSISKKSYIVRLLLICGSSLLLIMSFILRSVSYPYRRNTIALG